MKDLKRLKLVQLSKDELKRKEMDLIKGGSNTYECCGCGSNTANKNANSSYGYGHSSTGSASCYDWFWGGNSGWYGAVAVYC